VAFRWVRKILAKIDHLEAASSPPVDLGWLLCERQKPWGSSKPTWGRCSSQRVVRLAGTSGVGVGGVRVSRPLTARVDAGSQRH
jgi:hypothetical protein